MSNQYDVAVVGATGLVGEALLDILYERQFPVGQVYALASERSKGKHVNFGDNQVIVRDVKDFDFSSAQFAFFSAGSEVSSVYVPKAAEQGCIAIDNTSCFRYDDSVPLVVPEVNPHALAEYPQNTIIANPNCSTIQMLVALKPLYDAVGIKRIHVSTYQAVSGAGRSAVEELAVQTARLLAGEEVEPRCIPKQIAFNAVPQIDVFQENGYTKEEMKMVWETQKIFEDKTIEVNPTAVRVPVFYGHSEAIHIETYKPINAEEAKDLLRGAPGVLLIEGEDYPTSITDAVNQDAVFVGRIRADLTNSCGLNMWVVADNVRKGAALNAVQIAELIINQVTRSNNVTLQ